MPSQTFECQQCKQQVSRRKSVAIQPSEQDEHKFVIAYGKKSKRPVTRKALPRRHRGKCPE